MAVFARNSDLRFVGYPSAISKLPVHIFFPVLMSDQSNEVKYMIM